MKNINNEYNSGKLNTVDPLSAQKRIGDRCERNRFRNLDFREEGRNSNVNREEEVENSFRSELSSLKSLVGL